MLIGQRIKQSRQNRKMSLVALADAAGLSKGFISQIEAGKSNPSIASLGSIARVLKVPMSALTDVDSDRDHLPASEGGVQPQLLSAQNSYQERQGLAQISGLQAGSHYMAAIPPFSSLANSLAVQDGTIHNAILIVLQDSLTLRQGASVFMFNSGETATWNAASPYSLENRNNKIIRAILFIPAACSLPDIRPLDPMTTSPRSDPGRDNLASSYDGPMRLAGMRARRGTEGRR